MEGRDGKREKMKDCQGRAQRMEGMDRAGEREMEFTKETREKVRNQRGNKTIVC